jgi:hypothetical protein
VHLLGLSDDLQRDTMCICSRAPHRHERGHKPSCSFAVYVSGRTRGPDHELNQVRDEELGPVRIR